MGNYIYKTIMCRKEVRILSIGLDAAGKTTILYKLKLGEVVTTIPTIGFNVETIKHAGVHVTCWDLGLRDKMRPLIRHYLPGTDGLVFVVDSNDRERLTEALEDILGRISHEEELGEVPVLVLANKQDLDNVMSPEEIIEAIEKSGHLRHHPWKVFGTSGLNGDGLHESLDWLTSAIIDGKKEQFMDHLGTISDKKHGEDLDEKSAGHEQSSLSYFSGFVEYLKTFFGEKIVTVSKS